MNNWIWSGQALPKCWKDPITTSFKRPNIYNATFQTTYSCRCLGQVELKTIQKLNRWIFIATLLPERALWCSCIWYIINELSLERRWGPKKNLDTAKALLRCYGKNCVIRHLCLRHHRPAYSTEADDILQWQLAMRNWLNRLRFRPDASISIDEFKNICRPECAKKWTNQAQLSKALK